LFCCLPSVLAASAAGVCQACKDPRFKKKNHDVGLLVLLAAATCNALAVLVLELQSEKLGRVRLSACGQ
jgi:hypothetical protein